jgi:DNA-binding response OmpR family regulator
MLTDPILDANKRLHVRISELEETIRQLRVEAGERGQLPDGLPYLTRQEEAVLRTLLSRRGVASRGTIFDEMHHRDSEAANDKIVDVIICKLRRKLTGTDIKICTRWGRGWYIERATFQAARLTADQSAVAEIAA